MHRMRVHKQSGVLPAAVFSLLWLASSLLLQAAPSHEASDVPPRPTLSVRQDASGDIRGTTDAAIRAALERLKKAGGGTLLLGKGVWRLESGLTLSGNRHLRMLGEPGTILRAAPQPLVRTRTPADRGSRTLVVEDASFFRPDMTIEIQAPGRRITSPAGKTFRQPFIMSHVQRVDGDRLVLTRPLPTVVPAGTTVLGVFNGITIRAPAEDIVLADLTIDMNRDAWPVPPKNHTYHCCIFVTGPYSYQKGPTGPPVTGLRIVRCELRNAHHRGVAFYSVTRSGVYDCRIENTAAEGIDFDHFCRDCAAVNNRLDRTRNIELNDASYCLISGNVIEHPAVGVVIWQWCTLPELNTGNVISRNLIRGSRGHGIHLQWGADENILLGNTIEEATGFGIVVEGKGNVLAGNTVTRCRAGTMKVIQGRFNVVTPEQPGRRAAPAAIRRKEQ